MKLFRKCLKRMLLLLRMLHHLSVNIGLNGDLRSSHPLFSGEPDPPARVFLSRLLKRKAQSSFITLLKRAKILKAAMMVGLDVDNMVFADGLGVAVPYQPLQAP